MSKADQHKAEIVDSVVALAKQRLDPAKGGMAERFIRLYFRNVPPHDVLREGADTLYSVALGLLQFGGDRRKGEVKIRIFNPAYDDYGWRSPHTVVEIINDDMPFLVDSVTGALAELGLAVHLVVHPILAVTRDAQGRLTDVQDPAAAPEGAPAESFMHLQIDERTDQATLDRIAATLRGVLADVRAAVADWSAMRQQIRAVLDELDRKALPVDPGETREIIAFLEWLEDDHFTFLGYRRYDFARSDEGLEISIVPDSGLGILRQPDVSVFDGARRYDRMSEEAQSMLRSTAPLSVTKASLKATVHRPVHLDVFTVKIFDDAGEVVGDHLFVGLFTSVAYSRSARDIPYLRAKVSRTLAQAGLDPRSHDGKALAHILDTYPRDELFQISDEQLLDIGMGILHLQERQRTALFVRRDPFGRFVSCLVYVPRDRYNTDLRHRIQRILEKAYGGPVTAFTTQMTEGAHARVHFLIKTEPGAGTDEPVDVIEERLVEAGRSWADLLQSALIEKKGEEQGLTLLRRYAEAFPAGYREETPPAAAIVDIERIEEIDEDGEIGLHLFRPIEVAANELRFKLYHRGTPVPLSDVLPMLEHLGFKVVSEFPTEVAIQGQAPVWIHDFEMRSRSGEAIDLNRLKTVFQTAFERIWTGDMEDDRLNRLVLAAGLDWRSVTLLRAYARFLRQARFAFSQETIEDTLVAHPEITRAIVRMFTTRFDPDLTGDREVAIRGMLVEIEHMLDAVTNLDEDRILRRYLNLVRSTLRTNFFQADGQGRPKPYLSLKLESPSIEELPLPRPWREIFVYSPRMEGVHLRGGKVARGGIRWSDRREDFRTEILGLMKAQMVKNTVIVPVGSKGGFVLKRPPAPSAGREAFQAEGIECYKLLMRGMLDITDTIVGGETRHPERVVRHDEDDPYLVVAADKGTATFSDIANGVSQDYGFWLDDAFASGGSAGYDHKKMGITARGAWESVKRHFRELGTDIQSQDFTCVGVGDMSGDVFGNGMILSEHTRLVGAFNHLHIFVDPNPDAATSFTERKRLFDLGRGSWDQYDASLLSPGGAVFDRKAKSVKLSPEVRARFGIERETVTPNELIQAMLKAEVDLLWFGGIGTYVKGSRESHADVGDKANDPLRINGRDVRARVIGEGANLAVTQFGRIEYARIGAGGSGGKLNTDFIDNSAGVDTSDHEVNIKILLGAVVQAGDLTLKQRNQVLESMTEEVGHLVLRDNYLQSQALSLAAGEGFEILDQQARFMRGLEKAGKLDRVIEMLPTDEELTQRSGNREGLTRPEQAVLLAYAKITLYDALLASDLPDDPALVDDLFLYFPTALRERFKDAIPQHRLRREIVATAITNSMVNRVGATFVSEMADKTGMNVADIARAYLIVRDSFGLREIWAAVEALDNRAQAQAQIRAMLATRRLIERSVAWILRQEGRGLDISQDVAHLKPGLAELESHLDAAIFDEARAVIDARAKGFVEAGFPEDLARRVARLNLWAAGLDIIRIADQAGRGVTEVASVYFETGRRLGLAWLRDGAVRMPASNHWQKQAVGAIVDDLYTLQADLTVRALQAAPGATGGEAVEAWVGQRRAPVDRIDQLVSELKALDQVDLSMLAVANRNLRSLATG